jgi:uncharacterized protein
MHIFISMKVTWDPKKAATNLLKHKIRFSDAESVLFDPYALTIEDKDSEGEQRHISIGMDCIGRILLVIYTYRSDEIRLISARKATTKEKKSYEKRI